jgi:hypothetical protein
MPSDEAKQKARELVGGGDDHQAHAEGGYFVCCRECVAKALDAFAEERVREVAGRVGERVAEEVAAIVQREKHAAVVAVLREVWCRSGWSQVTEEESIRLSNIAELCDDLDRLAGREIGTTLKEVRGE